MMTFTWLCRWNHNPLVFPSIHVLSSLETQRPRAIREELHTSGWEEAVCYPGESPMTLPALSWNRMPTVNKASCDDLWQAVTAELMKMVAVWLNYSTIQGNLRPGLDPLRIGSFPSHSYTTRIFLILA